MWQIGAALAVLALGAWLLKDHCIFGVSATLLANWIINTALVRILADTAPWGWFLTIDYLSGAFVIAGVGLICHRFTLGSVLVGLSYALECVMHAAYGLSDHGAWASYQYWWATFSVAVAQMLIVLGWGAYELARRTDRARRGVSSNLAVAPRGGSHQTPAEP